MNAICDRELRGEERWTSGFQADEATSAGDLSFVAMLAHEIRNILHPLTNASELLSMPGLDESTALQAQGAVRRQVGQLTRLVNDLLEARRRESQSETLALQCTDLVGFMQNLCDDHCGVFAMHGIDLSLTSSRASIPADVDRDRLGQVMNNLLNNSLKFTDSGGSVRIELSLDAKRAVATICVTDTGAGIEPAAIEQIFYPHVYDSSHRNPTGLGLGLPLAKRLVELHGGRITAHSDGYGRGATFEIMLPQFAYARRQLLSARASDD